MIAETPTYADIGLGDDEGGVVTKVAGGRWADINRMDMADVSQMLLMLLGPAGDVASVGVVGLGEGWKQSSKREKLEHVLGLDLSRAKATSRVAREGLDHMEAERQHAMGAAGAAATGAVAGTMILPGAGTLVGGIVASIAGSIAGQQIYDTVIKGKTQDALEIVAKLRLAQQQGVTDIPEGAVAAALMASMPVRLRSKMEDRLEELAGTRQFDEAVTSEKTEELVRVAKEFDTEICSHTGMVCDPLYPEKRATEQFAELINSRRMDARDLLFTKDHLAALEAMIAGNEAQLAGVAPAADGDMQQLPPLPPGYRART